MRQRLGASRDTLRGVLLGIWCYPSLKNLGLPGFFFTLLARRRAVGDPNLAKRAATCGFAVDGGSPLGGQQTEHVKIEHVNHLHGELSSITPE